MTACRYPALSAVRNASDPVDVLTCHEEELVLRARAAGFAVGAVLLALVEGVGCLLRRSLDDEEDLG
jgi:hypothetical protein